MLTPQDPPPLCNVKSLLSPTGAHHNLFLRHG